MIYLALTDLGVFTRYGWFSSPEPMTSQAPRLTSPHYEDCLKLDDVQKGCINMKDTEVEKRQCQDDMPVFVNAPSNATIARTIPLAQAVDAVFLFFKPSGFNPTYSC